MNRSTVKVQEKGWKADLRNDEVDGHLLTGKKTEDLGVGEERPLLKFLEFSGNAAAEKVDFGL